MGTLLITGAKIVNEGKIIEGDVLIRGERIEKIDTEINYSADQVIEAAGRYLFPGVIDDQVHFREPGLTHKATLYTESRAAVAGGVTSFMEMPNTIPNALTQELLEDKYQIASRDSLANYSFFMGASNDNLEEVKKTDPKWVCGIKIFMGSSTGNMLVDDEKALHALFSSTNMLIATHCEDEETIRKNTALYIEKYGDDIPIQCHPEIRSAEACFLSSSKAVRLAKDTGARLHVLHISTARELEQFISDLPIAERRITAEACIHHLWFCDEDYSSKGSLIKWNPAVKTSHDRDAIFQAVLKDTISVVATDHAPHTLEEKSQSYLKAPSGGPLIQHTLNAMLEFYHQGKIGLAKIAAKMAHHPAELFRIKDRGYIREGYYADLVLVDLNSPWTVSKDNILAKCGWSPFEGSTFSANISHTLISGRLAYQEGNVIEGEPGMRLEFNV